MGERWEGIQVFTGLRRGRLKDCNLKIEIGKYREIPKKNSGSWKSVKLKFETRLSPITIPASGCGSDPSIIHGYFPV